MAGAFHTAGLSAGGRMALKSLKLRQSSILPLHMVCGRTEGAECLCAGCGGRACLSPSLHCYFACCACEVDMKLRNTSWCPDFLKHSWLQAALVKPVA